MDDEFLEIECLGIGIPGLFQSRAVDHQELANRWQVISLGTNLHTSSTWFVGIVELDVGPDDEHVATACGVIVHFAEETVPRVHVDEIVVFIKIIGSASLKHTQRLVHRQTKLEARHGLITAAGIRVGSHDGVLQWVGRQVIRRRCVVDGPIRVDE